MASGRNWIILAAVAVGAYFFLSKKGSSTGARLQPANINGGEQVRAASYRVIRQRRPGLQYVQVTKGAVGSEITFTSPSKGKFTRNVIQEGNQLWAEIAA